MIALLSSYAVVGGHVVYAALFQSAAGPADQKALDDAESRAANAGDSPLPPGARLGERSQVITAEAAVSPSMGGLPIFYAHRWHRPILPPAKPLPSYAHCDTAGKVVKGQAYVTHQGSRYRFLLFADDTYYCHTGLDKGQVAAAVAEIESKKS